MLWYASYQAMYCAFQDKKTKPYFFTHSLISAPLEIHVLTLTSKVEMHLPEGYD